MEDQINKIYGELDQYAEKAKAEGASFNDFYTAMTYKMAGILLITAKKENKSIDEVKQEFNQILSDALKDFDQWAQ